MALPRRKYPLSTFGAWLLETRVARSVSQSDLAASLGCRSSYVYRVERGLSSPSPTFLRVVSELLEVPLDEVYGRADRMPPEQVGRFAARPARIGRLLELTDRLNERQLDVLIEKLKGARIGKGAPAARQGRPS